MTKEEGRRELRYQITMSLASDMVKKGIINHEDYRAYETKMREKYQPVFGDLFWDNPPK